MKMWCMLVWLSVMLAALPGGAAQAQAPVWQQAVALTPIGGHSAITEAVMTTTGDIVVTGMFQTSVTLGATTLTGAGQSDIFVAKWRPTTNTWVWAVAAGGGHNDVPTGLAVQGNAVYVVGTVVNDYNNTMAVQFGSRSVPGLGPILSLDGFVARYTDTGTAATCDWVKLGGGYSSDSFDAVAVQGNAVYVLATVSNDRANTQAVQFGLVTLVGAAPLLTTDLALAKYIDTGRQATCVWATGAGGAGADYGADLVVQGTSLYLTGSIENNLTNAQQVRLTTVVLPGATAITSNDVLLAHYTDAGATAACDWAIAEGGTGADGGQRLVVQGTRVYVAGQVQNQAGISANVRFGTTTLAGTGSSLNYDVLLACYTTTPTAATCAWAVTGGGTGNDIAPALAVSGPTVYVGGTVSNDTANSQDVRFGGTALPGLAALSNTALLVAKYLDAGSSATYQWATATGSAQHGEALSLLPSGADVYVAGKTGVPATFGSIQLSGSSFNSAGLLARFTETSLASTPGAAPGAVGLYPNPASGSVWVQLPATAAPTEAVLLDVRGQVQRRWWLGPAPAELPLAGVPAGLYSLRLLLDGAYRTQRLVVY